jgi:peptidoglycan/xylan/chitin deacetylase (PgdA/CDA1 family)
MSDPLFEIGVHGWAHRNVRGLSGVALVDEMLNPARAYRQVRANFAARACAGGQPAGLGAVPDRVGLHRFPYGACNAAALETAADNGLLSIQWDVSTGDPAPSQSARAIADAMLRNTRPGSIIIAHANGRGHHTAEALLLAIRSRGDGLRVRHGERAYCCRQAGDRRHLLRQPARRHDRYDFRSPDGQVPWRQSSGWRSTTTTSVPR